MTKSSKFPDATHQDRDAARDHVGGEGASRSRDENRWFQEEIVVRAYRVCALIENCSRGSGAPYFGVKLVLAVYRWPCQTISMLISTL